VISVLSPQRIVIGGGVSFGPNLLELVQQNVVELMNGYLAVTPDITHPALGSRSGVLGAIALAETAQ
jgi:predicted NBD/HSP70 family sugar kinase